MADSMAVLDGKEESRSVAPTMILGLPRSGTTLLWDILRHDPAFQRHTLEPLHPDIFHETLHHPWYGGNLPSFAEMQQFYRSNFWMDPLRVDRTEPSPILEQYLRLFLTEGALCKSIRMMFKQAWFRFRFQDVKTICIVRDPRAVCYSAMHGPMQSDLVVCTTDDFKFTEMHMRLLAGNTPCMDMRKPLFEDPVYMKTLWVIGQAMHEVAQWCPGGAIVYYEHLVRSPQTELARIYKWLGRPIPDEVLARTHQESWFEHAGWGGPIHRKSFERFECVHAHIWTKAYENLNMQSVLRFFMYGNPDGEHPGFFKRGSPASAEA